MVAIREDKLAAIYFCRVFVFYRHVSSSFKEIRLNKTDLFLVITDKESESVQAQLCTWLVIKLKPFLCGSFFFTPLVNV